MSVSNRDSPLSTPIETDAAADVGRFSDALARFAATIAAERIDLGTINCFLGRRSIGALLLLLALPMALPVPAPGLSAVFGVPMIVVSAQLLVGRRQAWLPAALARRTLARRDFVALVARLLPVLRRIERIARPRLGWLAAGWATAPVGLMCLLLSAVIVLPIPMGNVVPGAAVSLMALGLIERDGLAVCLGLVTACLGLAIIAAASAGVVAGLRGWFGI